MTAPVGKITREDTIKMDGADPIAHLRERFELPEGDIYLDGNSLGALPLGVMERLEVAVKKEWGQGLIRSWNDADWYPAPQRAGAAIARILGADDDEVIVCDSISVNLFKLLVGALRMRKDRKIIVSEIGNFPTDVYINQEVADLMGCELRCVMPEEVEAAISAAGDNLAIVQLTHVHYKTGRIYDMQGITKKVQDLGGLVIWDLAHSAGCLPVQLNDCNADFAVGCGYKYLNGGPGAPAFVFVARRHFEAMDQPLRGWHGHAEPFAFTQEYKPHPTIDQMLTGTASQLATLALETALKVFEDVDMNLLRQKNMALGDLFIALVEQELGGMNFELASPKEAEHRGSQVSLIHEEGYAIMQAVIARGIIGDFRAPDILRFGFASPYVRYIDIWDSIAHLRDVMEMREWDQPKFKERRAVT
ncbi:MAG: kynureninase [Planktotalea sp.]|jgi:kynureninase|uniref:kynureninase n=1 Tax=Planktotalea sp. TaxID=2029877 RepID=UPI000183B129|nr:kynureninase [Planktotalea sp.]EDZ41102.1 kynureninase [Rhodobacteraceae bacterium HTCC2083]MDG1076780.1 kynureninase [Planktotalea sp.]HCW83770.1 kynureninase [Paracoccaceae bacterium]